MRKTKLEKGITLIALIISIVILLILAVVTIGSVKESSIIGNSKKTSSKYTIAQEKETLQLALDEWQIQRTLNKQTFKSIIKAALGDNAIKVSGNSAGPLTVKMAKTEHTYIVRQDGSVIEKNAEEELKLLQKYILGELLSGRNIAEIISSDAEGNTQFINETDTITDAKTSISIFDMKLESDLLIVYIYYNNDLYSFGIKNQEETDSNYGVVKVEYDLESYFIGKNFMDLIDSGLKFKDDSNTIFDASTSIEYVVMSSSGAYVRFMEGIYKLEGNDNQITNVKEIELGERVGKKVRYDNKMWTILYDDTENGLQMISDEALLYNNTKFSLGVNDTLIEWNNIADADFDEKNGLSDFEKAVYSYNNAIKTLNTACEKIVAKNSNIISVRSVGSNPINKNLESSEFFESEELENLYIDNIKGLANGRLKCGDSNEEFDGEMLGILGLNIKDNECWFASRCVGGLNQFGLYQNAIAYETLIRFYNNDSTETYNVFSEAKYLRPVVTLKEGIVFSGNGTPDAPYTFN